MRVRWLPAVRAKDIDAAQRYLRLRLSRIQAASLAEKVATTSVERQRANDILRACDREPLPRDDPGVLKTHRKIKARRELGPVIVVSFDFGGDIADGYHRVSECYHIDPFMDVACVVVSL